MYSLRRKELFWHYKLGVLSPKGLNERVADIELDFLLVGALKLSTFALRSRGSVRRCWPVNFVHFARGVGVEFPIGPFGI